MNIKEKLAVQLYSVRKEMERDLEGTLRKIHEIGFHYVQLDGMRGNDSREVRCLLQKYELKVIGMHIKHDRFMNDLVASLKKLISLIVKLFLTNILKKRTKRQRATWQQKRR